MMVIPISSASEGVSFFGIFMARLLKPSSA